MSLLSRDRCLIIAEIAQGHDGSLGIAHAYIDAVSKAGADAIKFQTHIAEAESTPKEPFRVNFSYQDKTRFDYWKRLEFSEAQWKGLADHTRERGLLFLSSPFSSEAVELLDRIGVPAWKVASGEITNMAMLDRIVATGKPVLLSSGMSRLAEIDRVVERLRRAQLDFAVMQCTTAYPCPPEKVGLNMLGVFRERYPDAFVGLSDHSGTIFPGLAHAANGMDVLEVHVTFSREMFGPDVAASLTTAELRILVEGVRFIEKMRTSPVDKDAAAAELAEMRQLFTKSIVAAGDLPAGTVLAREHLAVKKPGTGIPPERLPELVGKRLTRAVRADQLLDEADLA